MNKPSPLEEVIREEDFLPIMEAQGKTFFQMANTLIDLTAHQWEKGHLFRLVLEANELESFLDDFGARKNRTFGLIGEMVASLRWVAQACFTLKHTLSRLDGYFLDIEHLILFKPILKKNLLFLETAAQRLLSASKEQCTSLGLRLPKSKLNRETFTQIRAERYLPENWGEDGAYDGDVQIAELSARYLAVCDMVHAAFPDEKNSDPKGLVNYAGRFCREEQLRICQVSVHNLQSRYDTYIKNSALETNEENLSSLRGHISVVLHLLECGTYLVHLDERHENDLRVAKTRQIIASLVDRPSLIALVVDFLVKEAKLFLREGSHAAKSMLAQFTREDHLTLTLPKGVSLHARPASLIVSIVNHYGLPVEIEIKKQRANASSIMAVMILAGKNPGAKKIGFHGEYRVLKDLELLFKSILGEKGRDGFPKELSYLTGKGADL